MIREVFCSHTLLLLPLIRTLRVAIDISSQTQRRVEKKSGDPLMDRTATGFGRCDCLLIFIIVSRSTPDED